jgi:hypothetical protein
MSERALRVGDWIEVRSKAEILRTLDGDARLDSMPFIPEMFACRGQRTQMWKCARRTCARAIHLYWREIWLERVPAPQEQAHADALGPVGRPLASSTCETRGSA